jgi:F-type H+-transporting ATPase subunit b
MYKVILGLIITSAAHAASKGTHHASIKDLMWPAINFSILFGFIGWKLKGALKTYFKNNADLVKELFEKAKNSHAGAKNLKDEFQSKIANLSVVEDKVMKGTITDVLRFKQESTKDTDERIERLRQDSVNRIEHEKVSGLREIEKDLVENVIGATKDKVNSDSDFRRKVSENLLNQI